MAKDFIQFNNANNYVTNKDMSLTYYMRYMLNRTQAMFSYTGLPDTIPQAQLELMLQQKGYAFITEVEGKLYALYGGLGGEPDVYGESTEITVANPALKLSRTFTLETDGVLMDNDTLRIGLLPLLYKYGSLLAENTITMRTVDIILRMVMLISASDDRTYSGAEKFIKDIENGKLSAVGESAFFDGIKVHNISNVQNYLTQFIEYEQYLKASCYNEIGLNANYNMKREEIGSQESSLNDDLLLPLVDNMIKCRQIAIDRINEKYGTEITIDYASAWKVTHMENEKQKAISESITEQVESGNGLDVSIEHRTLSGYHDINQPHIEIGGKNENIQKPEDETKAGRQNIPEPESGRQSVQEPDTQSGEHEQESGSTSIIREGETTGDRKGDTESSEEGGEPVDGLDKEYEVEVEEKDGEDDDRNKS